MKESILSTLVFLSSFINLATMCSAESVVDIVKMLNSNDWFVRDRGVEAAKSVSDNDQVRIELIKLLERENKQFEDIAERNNKRKEMKDSSTEQETFSPNAINGEYYYNVIKAVVALKDPRAIKSLAGSLGTGNTARKALTSFGDLAIEPLMDAFANNKRRHSEPDIVETLNKILDQGVVSAIHKNKIKNLLLNQVNKTPSRRTKQKIIAAFVNFSDDNQVVTILESLIASDTYYEMRRVKGRPKTERVKVFPIKEEAEKALGRIRAKRKEKHQELPSGTTQQSKTQ